MIKNIIVLLLTACMLVIGQALWKLAANQIKSSSDSIISTMIQLTMNKFFLLGSLLYILATGAWIYMLDLHSDRNKFKL